MVEKYRRIYYLDHLRILACALVIFNHTNGYGMFMTTSRGVLVRCVYMLPVLLTRVNVPIFFMISGVLLLSREENKRYIIRYRIIPIIIILLVASSIYYISTSDVHSIGEFIRRFLEGRICTPYWFLYAYLGFLCLMPYLKRISDKFSKDDLVYFCMIHALFSVGMPLLDLFLQIRDYEPISPKLVIPIITENFMFYPLLGNYLSRIEIGKIKLKKIAVAALFGWTITVICTVYQGIKFGYTQNYVMMFDWLTAILIFLAARDLEPYLNKIFKRFRATIVCISSLTFGIYLIDPILRKPFGGIVDSITKPYMITIVASTVWVIFSISVGGIITFGLKKIPGIGRFL